MAKAKYRRGVRSNIESVEKACMEDRTRALKLSHELKIGTSLIDDDRARELARMLARSAERPGPAETLASSRYMRKQRLRLSSSLWEFIDGLEEPYTTFTLISERWITLGEDLISLEPRKLLRAVRSDLNRCGGTTHEGAIFMALDGEFDVERSVFQPHIHGLAIGPMIDVVDRLRSLKKFRPAPIGTAVQPPIHRPVWINRADLTNLPKPLTYLLKSYWTCWWDGMPCETSSGRKGRLMRVPEPFHSNWLIWMDQWNLSDLTIMMGMYVGSEGFALS